MRSAPRPSQRRTGSAVPPITGVISTSWESKIALTRAASASRPRSARSKSAVGEQAAEPAEAAGAAFEALGMGDLVDGLGDPAQEARGDVVADPAPVGVALGDLVAERAQQLGGLGDAPLDRRRRRSAAPRARGGRVDQATRSLPGGVCADSTKGRSGGGGASGSCEPPAMTSSQSAVSSTVRLTQPFDGEPVPAFEVGRQRDPAALRA